MDDTPHPGSNRPHAARYSHHIPQRTLWYERRNDFRKVLAVAAGLILLILAFAALGTLRDRIESSKSPYGFFKNMQLGARLFGIVCFVIFSTPRLLRQAGLALRGVTPRSSRLNIVLHDETVVSGINAVFLALLVVGLTNVVMAWVAFSCKPCDPEREKALGWRLAQGTREHVKEGLKEWWVFVYSPVSVAYALHVVGVWPHPGENVVRWRCAAVIGIAALSTAAQWSGFCSANVYFRQVWSVIATVCLGLWVVGNSEILLRKGLDDLHFELVWYFAAWYLINEAPGQGSC